VHVAPRAADPQHVKHAVNKAPIVVGRAAPASSFSGQHPPDDPPFLVRQIATYATGLRKDQG
jgi:hypothetical protein